MAFYVLDENNNKVEALDKQGVLAVLAQAIEDGSLDNITADSAFISKLKCCVGGDTFKVAFITQAKYNELKASDQLVENCYYYIIDDTTCEDIDKVLEELTKTINEIEPLAKDARQKSDYVQYLDNSNFDYTTDLLYESGQTLANFPKKDISSLLKKGKTYADIIGVGGCLIVNGFYHLYFNCIWNIDDTNAAICTASVTHSNNNFYLFQFTIRADNALRISKIICRNLTTNEDLEVTSVGLYSLNIYYK